MKGKRVGRDQLGALGTRMLDILRKSGFSSHSLEILLSDLCILAKSWSEQQKFRKNAAWLCPVIPVAYSSLVDSMERLHFLLFPGERYRGWINCRPETMSSLCPSASMTPHWMVNLPNPNYTKGLHHENAACLIGRREAPKGMLKTQPLGINDYGFLTTEEVIFYTAFYGNVGKYSYCAKSGRLAGSFESYPCVLADTSGKIELRNEVPTSLRNVVYPFCFARSSGIT